MISIVARSGTACPNEQKSVFCWQEHRSKGARSATCPHPSKLQEPTPMSALFQHEFPGRHYQSLPVLQCRDVCLGSGVGHPIHQTAFSPPPLKSHHSVASPPRLACRSSHWLQIFQAVGTQVEPGVSGDSSVESESYMWRLIPWAALQTSSR